MSRVRFGVGSYTWPWAVGIPGHPVPQALTQEELLERAIGCGARVAQFCENLPLEGLDAARLGRLRERAAGAGVRLEVGRRGTDPASLQRSLEFARELGSPILRLVIDDGYDRPSPEEVVRRLRALGPAEGVALAIENHDRFPAPVLRAIVEAVGPGWVGVTYDTANSLGCLEGPAETLAVLGPYVRCVHIKDVRIEREPHMLGFRVFGVAAGSGQIDVRASLEAAPNGASVILEQWPPRLGTIEATLDREAEMFETGWTHLAGWV